MPWRKRRAPLRVRLLEGRWVVQRKHPVLPAWRVLQPTHERWDDALEHARALVKISGAEKASQQDHLRDIDYYRRDA